MEDSFWFSSTLAATMPVPLTTITTTNATTTRRKKIRSELTPFTRWRSVSARSFNRPAGRGSFHRQAEVACDDQTLDLARAFTDLEDLRVTVEATHRCLVDVAVATVDLHRVAGGIHSNFTCVELRHRRRLANRQAAVAQAGRLVDEIAGVLHRDRHVGALERDRLVPA